MPDSSAILALPYIMPSQAQKHVTHNEALRRLDVLVQLTVEQFGALNPPALPQNGKVYALGTGATGAWSGHDHELAARIDDAWEFFTPIEGWRAYGQSVGQLRVWSGTSWVQAAIDTENLAGVGLNTTSDTTNRLSVSAPATLLSHEGDDHQLKINKAATGDTGSLLLQTGWSGRAELGLAGDDDFSIKVSSDGSAWNTALQIDKANGRANLPAGSVLGGFFGFTMNGQLSISGGAITAIGSYHSIDTEGDTATDNLDTINGGDEGDILILRTAHAARDVAVRHGVDNIICGSDLTLSSPNSRIVLQKRGSNWNMISFAAN